MLLKVFDPLLVIFIGYRSHSHFRSPNLSVDLFLSGFASHLAGGLVYMMRVCIVCKLSDVL